MKPDKQTRHSNLCAPRARHIRLEEPSPQLLRILSECIQLQEGETQTWVTVTRTGQFKHPTYGDFEITQKTLQDIVTNFDRRVYGQDVFIDVAHEPKNGAAAKVLKLAVEGNKLRALVEWTPFGVASVRQKGYRYLSIDYTENYRDNEGGAAHGPLMFGAGLVTRPFVKHLDPIQLAEAEPGAASVPIVVAPEFQARLLSEIQDMWKKLIERLKALAASRKLSEPLTTQLVATAEVALANVTDEQAAIALIESFEANCITLSEQAAGQARVAPTSAPGAITLSEEDVRRIVREQTEAAVAAQRQLNETRDTNLRTLQETINAAPGLAEQLRRELFEAVQDLVTPETTAEQVRRLAQVQIDAGNRLTTASRLSAMGFPGSRTGSVRIETPSDGARRLTEIYRDGLRNSEVGHELRLPERDDPFVTRILAEFDRLHDYQIHQEVRALADTGAVQTDMARTQLPVGFQREVIREALQDLNIFQLVQTLTDFGATATTQIPYEERDLGEVTNDGIVFEGRPIPRASINQKMDLAFILQTKLGMEITNEVIHFTRNGPLNWDAMARNVQSNARIIRERIARRIANEMQRAADAYLAREITGEAVAADGAGLIKTAQFPVVRPYQPFNLNGEKVGDPECPIVLTIDGKVLDPFEGSGDQPAGNYYRLLSVNLGYIQVVNEKGEPVPGASGTIDYFQPTNIVKVDIDAPAGVSQEKHLNKLLQAVGSRKAMLSSQRFVNSDFMLMSPTLNDSATNAEQFYLYMQKNGTNTDAQGDLQAIKGIPAFGTNAPGIDLGDERILLGKRNLLGYVVTKPWSMTEPFQSTDPSTGRAVGKLQMYGEEYSAIKIPKPLQRFMTSVLAYSASNR
ncbi:phage protease [Burkholderia cenocepacia]|uniref:phage protease n=1 Tax=Burkholderia cenocepacia TaxID=95486 RepID=UPI001B9A0A92|nr:phage protease [Burkholderia cenocepacia]MBR8137193.1 hypothetical protein [Burkholderia cenocepacia]